MILSAAILSAGIYVIGTVTIIASIAIMVSNHRDKGRY
jgi:hypothetical protein